MIETITYLGLVDDEAIPLDVAALELAALDRPGIDLEPYVDTVTTLAGRLAEIGGQARSAIAQAEALSEVMAEEYGLAGDRETYEDPRNADLIDVIDRRRGMPVALSILYAAAARRIGWPAEILNTPGHVLMRLGPSTAPVLIDPFNFGRIVAAEQLAHLLRNMVGEDVTPSAEHMAPMANRMVLVRLLSNQATRAEAAGNPARARRLFERITTIAPAYGHGWWERARLELASGEVSDARSSLSAMLEMTRDPAMRAHISGMLASLA